MIDEDAKREFFEHLIGKAQSHRAVFTHEVIDRIGTEFGIPDEQRDEIGLILEVGANAFFFETQRSSRDFKRTRKELLGLESAVRTIEKALQNLSADTKDVLLQAGIARRLNGFHFPRISEQDAVPVLNYTLTGDQEARRITLAEIEAILLALGQCAFEAKPLAKASRVGRPEHEALYDFLIFAFQVWESVLQRAFKLDWASDGEPITDAARFSVRVSHIVEPSLTLQQIATASRKVREKVMSFRSLEEVPQVIEHYRKQFEWIGLRIGA